MLTTILLVGIKMHERQVTVITNRRNTIRKFLCSTIIRAAIAMIVILAIPAGVFLGAIACIWMITDKIIRVIDIKE